MEVQHQEIILQEIADAIKTIQRNTVVSPMNMTSETAPSPFIVKASRPHPENDSARYKPYTAFSSKEYTKFNQYDDENSGWFAFWSNDINVSDPDSPECYTTGNDWVQIKMDKPYNITELTFQSRGTYQNYNTNVADFTFAGSNDEINWTVLLDVKDNPANNKPYFKQSWDIEKLGFYEYFRITVTKINHNVCRCSIGRIQMKGYSDQETIKANNFAKSLAEINSKKSLRFEEPSLESGSISYKFQKLSDIIRVKLGLPETTKIKPSEMPGYIKQIQ